MSYQLSSNTMGSKILYIDSRDADSYLATRISGTDTVDLTSYFSYILKENIEVPLNQRALISLNSATIPYSFYNIRDGVNDRVKMSLGGTIKEVIVPAGNYNATSLSDFISNKFVVDWGGVINSMTMDFNEDTQKYDITIIADVNYPANSGFDFLDELSDIHNELGFRPEFVPFTIALVDGKYHYTTSSQNVIDINGSIHGVYIRTNLVSRGTLDSQSKTFSNILARIPINVQSGGIIFAMPSNETHKSLVDIRTINQLTIRLTDERNRILDLNGLHFQIAISIDFVYGEKPFQVNQGGLSENNNGDSFKSDYKVSSDNTAGQKIELSRQNQELESEVSRLQRNRRRVGRPRNVGRPRGSRESNN